jgi:hypothetical protein
VQVHTDVCLRHEGGRATAHDRRRTVYVVQQRVLLWCGAEQQAVVLVCLVGTSQTLFRHGRACTGGEHCLGPMTCVAAHLISVQNTTC